MEVQLGTLRLVTTKHAQTTIADKGFSPDAVRETFLRPDHTTQVRKYPDQIRLIGNGLALVGIADERKGIFLLITVYQDGVLTPPRADQMDTPEGQRYAQRYANGLGRG